MNRIEVVAGILTLTDERILITERTDDGPFHGMWEFPGGKIAPGESAADALSRELQEEIGIAVVDCEAFMHLRHDYPDRSVDIQFFSVRQWRGSPQGLEGQQMRWVFASDIEDGLMLPADLPVIAALQQGCPV